MNLYTIVTNDKYELPVKCGIRVKEAAEFIGTTTGNIRNMVLKPRKRSKYKVIISGKVEFDEKSYNKTYNKIYSMTHDRSEYFKKYYRRKKSEEKNTERIQI